MSELPNPNPELQHQISDTSTLLTNCAAFPFGTNLGLWHRGVSSLPRLWAGFSLSNRDVRYYYHLIKGGGKGKRKKMENKHRRQKGDQKEWLKGYTTENLSYDVDFGPIKPVGIASETESEIVKTTLHQKKLILGDITLSS